MNRRQRVVLARVNLLLWVVGLAIAACRPFPAAEEKIVLEVGERKVSAAQLKADIRWMAQGLPVGIGGREELQQALVERLLEFYRIQAWAQENKIKVSGEDLRKAAVRMQDGYQPPDLEEAFLRAYVGQKDWQRRLEQRLLVQKVMERVTEDIPLPTEEDLRAAYLAVPERFKISEGVKFRQIVVSSKEKATQLAEQLRQGGSMEDLARLHSEAPEAKEGGLVGWLSREELEESMAKALFALSEGEISSVVKTPYGYHIFQVIAFRNAGVRPLPEVVEELERELLQERREERLQAWLKDLKARIAVHVDAQALQEALAILG